VNSKNENQQMVYFRKFSIKPISLVLSTANLSSEGILVIPPSIRWLADFFINAFGTVSNASLFFGDLTKADAYQSMQEFQNAVISFYIQGATSQIAKLLLEVTRTRLQNHIVKPLASLVEATTSMTLLDVHKLYRVRPATRIFTEDNQLLEFNSQECEGKMFMLQNDAMRHDKHVMHKRAIGMLKDERVVVLSSAHLAVMKPTNKMYVYETKFIAALKDLTRREVDGNHINVTVKSKTTQITFFSSSDALQFINKLELCIKANS